MQTRNRWLAACVLLLASASTAAADADASITPSTPTTAAAACPPAPSLAGVSVTRVDVTPSWGEPAAKPEKTPVVELRREVQLTVEKLPVLLEYERCSSGRGKLVLYLDGRPLDSAVPYPPSNPAEGTLKFVLERNGSSRDVWTHLLGKPNFTPREVPVSVGMSTDYPVRSSARVLLRTIPPLWFGVWVLVFLALLGFFLALATRSNVLRDPGPEPTAGRKRYSLARVQAAWWFFICLAAYLFIGLVTGDYGTTITSTVLTLLGISAGTMVGASTIDSSQANAAQAAAPGLPVVSAATRGSWWLDILSDDGNGVSFHRFQLASWTFVLGIVFVIQVYKALAMPDFDNSLLALMGLSAGTYLGLKTTTEKKA